MSEKKKEEKTAEEKKTEAIENNQPRPQKTAEPIDKPADLEKMVAELLEGQKKLKKEINVNRVMFGICLVVSLLYIHFQAVHLGDIIGTLIEMFMPS